MKRARGRRKLAFFGALFGPQAAQEIIAQVGEFEEGSEGWVGLVGLVEQLLGHAPVGWMPLGRRTQFHQPDQGPQVDIGAYELVP